MKRVLLVSTIIIIVLMMGGFVSGNTNVSGNETGVGVETVIPHGTGATLKSPLLEIDPFYQFSQTTNCGIGAFFLCDGESSQHSVYISMVGTCNSGNASTPWHCD